MNSLSILFISLFLSQNLQLFLAYVAGAKRGGRGGERKAPPSLFPFFFPFPYPFRRLLSFSQKLVPISPHNGHVSTQGGRTLKRD